MNYASVCDGIGAAHVAWKPLGWQCSWTSEIEPFPAAVVDHHFGFANVGDMTKITEEMLHEHGPVDLLVGGTPCQSFSVAGLRGGLADPRGNLALRFVQLAAVMQPKWIVWENVPGVLSSGKGRDFGTFLGALGEIGYGFAYRILDAQWFGVAQRRRRVFVVGHLGDWRRAAAVLFERESVFGNPPTRGAKGQDAAGSTGDGVARCVTTGEAKRQDWETCNFVAFHPTQDPISSVDGSTHAMGCGSSGGCCTQAVAVRTAQTSANWHGVANEVAHTLDQVQGQAVAFTKSKRDQSTTDDETWVPGEVSPTMSCFDQGDTRATTVVTTPIDLRQASRGEKVTNNRASGSGGPPGHGIGDGGDPAFTVSERGQAVVSIDLQNVTAGGDLAGTLDTTRPSRGGGQAVAFKPSHFTRGKDGAPADVVAPLSADADKGDQDTVVAFPISADADRSNSAALTPSPDAEGRIRLRDPGLGVGEDGEPMFTMQATKPHAIGTHMAVRRLTPRECERLQGFPDDYTLVEYRKKPAADGPRYRALGNSMAVPVMRWIGERIKMVDELRSSP